MPRRRVMVVGLDSLEPSLAFDRFADAMPNLSRLRARGRWGKLRSTIPPVTVPAWPSMTSGVGPGRLGVYGFRNRKGRTYEMEMATSRSIRVPRLWDLLSDAGLRVIALAVPGTYPPTPVHGALVSGCLTPSPESAYTHPATLRTELERRFGEYRMDVQGFRSEPRGRVLDDIYAMTDQRFDMARHLLGTRDWDFFMMVDMGPDRFHHAFWRFFDADHPRHEPGGPFADSGRRYYAHLDRQLGTLLQIADEDTTVLVVSDHGARPMIGGICVNEWLLREGYLALADRPRARTPLRDVPIDWSRTRSWAEGGYYARIFLNVRGRERLGTIPAGDYEKVRTELGKRLEALGDEQGRPLRTLCYRPEEVYDVTNGFPPDLLVFFGDLGWRAIGSVGTGAVHTFENDMGPDDANHDWDGVLVLAGGGVRGVGPLEGCIVEDVAPTVLDALGVEPPRGIDGTSKLG